jgi:hypothetical protein
MITNQNGETPQLLAQDIYWRLVTSPAFELNEQAIAKALGHAFTCAEAFFKALAIQKQKPPEAPKPPEATFLALAQDLEKALNALPEEKRKEALSGLGKAIIQAKVKAKRKAKRRKGH